VSAPLQGFQFHCRREPRAAACSLRSLGPCPGLSEFALSGLCARDIRVADCAAVVAIGVSEAEACGLEEQSRGEWRPTPLSFGEKSADGADVSPIDLAQSVLATPTLPLDP
jgi:hypothetical protein